MNPRLKNYLGLEFFVHPLPALAVAILILNDHYLKANFPSWITGKLSDFAGLFFFPLFLCALYCLARNLVQVVRKQESFFGLTRGRLLTAIAITDFIFIAIKVSKTAAHVYTGSLGAIGFPSEVTPDLSDLLALSMNLATYVFGRQFWRD